MADQEVDIEYGDEVPKALKIYDLNDDCLIKIFEELDTEDLIQLYTTSNKFNEIVKAVVPRKMIDTHSLNDIESIAELFRFFGKLMTRLTIHFRKLTFAQFLQMLLFYGKPGLLTEIEIHHWQETQTDSRLFLRTMPFFKNLTKLRIRGKWNDLLGQWLNIISTCRISSLTIFAFSFAEFPLNANNFPNLREFRLNSYRLNISSLDENRLKDFLLEKRNLRKFGCNVFTITQFAAVNLPNVEFLDLAYVGRHGNLFEWNVLNSMENLKGIKVASSTGHYQEIDECLKILATNKTLKFLDISLFCLSLMESENKEIEEFISSTYRFKLRCLDEFRFTSYLTNTAYIDHLLSEMICAKVINICTSCKAQLLTIVRCVHCLEKLVIQWNICEKEFAFVQIYKDLATEKLHANSKMKVITPLTIYVERTEIVRKWMNDLGA